MEPLSATASVIAVLQLSGVVLGYLNDVRDSSRERAKCAIEASNVHSLLVNLRFHLEDGDGREPWYVTVRALSVPDGPLDQFRKTLEELQARITGNGRFGKAGAALQWKFEKDEVAKILERMHRLKTLVTVALELDHFKLSKALKDYAEATHQNTELIKDDMSYVRDRVPVIESTVHAIQDEQTRIRNERILDWLSPTNYAAQQSDMISRRQAGTGDWFLKSTEFVSWCQTPKTTLFCAGIPGAGKTMIASIAIDYILKTLRSTGVGVIYMFLNYKQHTNESATSLLAALLRQIAQLDGLSLERVLRLYEQHLTMGTKPSLDEIADICLFGSSRLSTLYVVVDALDECPDRNGARQQLLANIKDLQSKTDIRFMATSRFVPDVLDNFKGMPTLEIRATDHDVRKYVVGQVHRLPKCVQRDDDVQFLVQDKICEAVDGMFLLARLHVDSLQDKVTKKAVKSALEKLSIISKDSKAITQIYDQAYQDAIQRINDQLPGSRELARKALSWIVCAQRRVTTSELCHALSVELEEDELDPDNVPDMEDIVSVCAGLVTVDVESDIIRLVHYTTQEFFHRVLPTWVPNAHSDIAATCLTYLNLSTPSAWVCHDRQRMRSEYPFLPYAANYWGFHAQFNEEDVCELACTFLQNPLAVRRAAILMSTTHNDINKLTTGLHLVSMFGLTHTFEKLLPRRRSTMVDLYDAVVRTPLDLAVKYSQNSMVTALLKWGAAVDPPYNYLGSPLQVASRMKNGLMIQELIDNGANVKTDCLTLYGSALMAASAVGDSKTIQLLLQAGADINSSDYIHGTALAVACSSGHEDAVKLLLTHRASLNIASSSGTPLQVAVVNGHEKVVLILLRHAHLHFMRFWDQYIVAIDQAHQSGFHRIRNLLIHGAATEYAGDSNDDVNNVFWLASTHGHVRAVEMLLAKGVDPNMKLDRGGSALGTACQCGHARVVEILISSGAIINTDLGNKRRITSLQAASYGGFRDIINILLKAGANVNAHGNYEFGTALQMAVLAGQREVVQILLDAGADIEDDAGELRLSPLEIAATYFDDDNLKLLLDRGAAWSTEALIRSSLLGHLSGIETLLSHAPDVEAIDEALVAASLVDQVLVVRLLLDRGANVSGTAVWAASVNNCQNSLEILVEKGGEVAGNALEDAIEDAISNDRINIFNLLMKMTGLHSG